MKLLGALPVVLLGLLLIGMIWGKCVPNGGWRRPEIRLQMIIGKSGGPLHVMVHGMGDEHGKLREQWRKLADELSERGDVALISYPAGTLSNADPILIAREINQQVQQAWEEKHYPRVVLVGNSMGALIARKSFLYSANAATDKADRVAEPWSGRVERLVLLAGMNRGWDLSDQKPSDMRWYNYLLYSAAYWFGNLTNSGQLIRQMESGTPFVANLRVEWMNWARESGRTLETVQLLGDIDEIVSTGDNQDLRVAATENFTWIKVRGTGHADILDIGEQEQGLGGYRLKKIISAFDLSFDELKRQSEELPYATDLSVTRIVFVVHGIRDLGKWSSRFETALQARVKEVEPDKKLAIASVRYGYFGMGPFLLRQGRQKYVRWFMDQYTETLARYPKATEIDFIGHSNGTYLLTSALELYRSMKIRRVVLAGSVVPKNYPWKTVFGHKQVNMVRNYVAEDDLVVALFPRFFETAPMRLFGNDIGSAGFNGFDAGNDGPDKQPVENIEFITGHHAAFMEQVGPIVDYLIPSAGQTQESARAKPEVKAKAPARTWPILKFISDWLTLPIWLALAFGIVGLGFGVSNAAGHLGWAALILYFVLLFQVLRWV